MRRDSWVLGIAGVVFGLLVGWIIANQIARPDGSASAAADIAATDSSAPPGTGGAAGQPSTAAPLDEARVQALVAQATQNPKDSAVRAQLGNLYFDAERYPESVKWYEASLALDPKNPDVSTDLGVSYYYTNQTDRALQQFAHSLEINPKHTKTMLNIGMVKAFGKQDLVGAAAAWQQVVQLAPDSPEGRAARQALDTLKQAHPDTAGGGATPAPAPAPPPGPGKS